METAEKKIFKVETFVDNAGREVKMYSRTDVLGGEIRYGGAIMVVMQRNGQKLPPKRFDFKFPEDTKSVSHAFEIFDDTWKSEMERERREYEEQQTAALREKKTEIVLPNGQPAPKTPFKFVGGEGEEL